MIKSIRAIEPLIACLRNDNKLEVRKASTAALLKIANPRAIGPLSAALEDENDQVRMAASATLAKINDTRVIEPLIVAIKDLNANVRQDAAKALGRFDDKQLVEPLIAALQDTDAIVRRFAAEALGKIEDKRSVEPLITTLQDKDKSVYKAAAEALGKIKDKRAIEPLIVALREEIGNTAAQALHKIGWQPSQDETGALYWTALKEWHKCVGIGSRAVDALISAYTDTIGGPIEALIKIDDVRAVELVDREIERMIDQLEKGDLTVKIRAAEWLEKYGDSRAAQPLVNTLDEKDWRMRKHAAWALMTLYRLCPNKHVIFPHRNKFKLYQASQARIP